MQERATAFALQCFTTPPSYNPQSTFTPVGVDATVTIHTPVHAIFPHHKTRGIPSVAVLNQLLVAHQFDPTTVSIGFHWEGNKAHGPCHKGFFLLRLHHRSDHQRLDLLIYTTTRELNCFSVVARTAVCPGGPNAVGNTTTTIVLHNLPESATVLRLKGACKPGGHVNCLRIHVSTTAQQVRTASIEFMHTPFNATEIARGLAKKKLNVPRRRKGQAVSLTARDIHTDTPGKAGSSTTNINSGWKHKGTDGGNPRGRDRNVSRSRIFRTWLENTFTKERLSQGAGIMDVAGGKGELSWELMGYGEMPATIVDPRPLDIVRMMKGLTANKIVRLRRESSSTVLDQTQLPLAVTAVLPLPKHVRCWFDYPFGSSKDSSLMDKNIATYHEDDLQSNSGEEKKLLALAQECSSVVGMHADQATEAIVDFGLASGKPFAVVPCCVFPEMFPHRRLKSGDGVVGGDKKTKKTKTTRKNKKNKKNDGAVRTYKEFCTYLEEKGASLARLEFPGRNVVVYGNV